MRGIAFVAAVAEDFAVADFDDALGIGRHFRVVSDQNHRVPRRVQLQQDAHDLLAAGRVEGAGRFVGEDHFAAVHQGAGDTHSLLLTAGELARPMRQMAFQTQSRQQLTGTGMSLKLRRTGVNRRHLDVVHCAQMRQQVVTLEDETKVVAAQLGQGLIVQIAGFLAVDPVAAGGGVIKATEDVHQRRFAGTGGTNDRHHFPGIDRQIDVVQREKLAVASGETAGDAGQL
ncbi:hypothetical protein D3C81_806650 [compost metagenome]